MEDYEALLDRALCQIPDIVTEKSRFVVPSPNSFSEGRTTILDNFGEIADVLNRDVDHFLKFLLQELGTAGKIEGGRAIFQGNFPFDVINSQIDDYVKHGGGFGSPGAEAFEGPAKALTKGRLFASSPGRKAWNVIKSPVELINTINAIAEIAP